MKPKAFPGLGAGEVHVWRIGLETSADVAQKLVETLSPDERARGERFYQAVNRKRFTVSHGALRRILSGYLDVPPQYLRFVYGPREKPALAGECGGETIRFNLSHSGGLALVAVTSAPAVGVDVERIRPVRDWQRIAQRVFSAREVDRLRRLPADALDDAFFSCWARKEAYIKAKGAGLSSLLVPSECNLGLARWSLAELEPGVGYAGALAVESAGVPLRCWQWEEKER